MEYLGGWISWDIHGMYIDNGDTWGFTLLFSNVIGKPKFFMIFARGFGWKRIQPNGKHVTNGLFIWWVWKYLKMRVDPIDVDMFAGKNVKMWKLEVPTRILILQIEGGIACFLGSRAVINLGYSIPKMVEELPICVGNPNNTSDSLRESRQDWARSSAPRCFGTFWSQPYCWGCSF